MKKIKLALSNIIFYITHFREIRKRDKIWKDETIKTEKQAKRILENDVLSSEEKLDW